MSKGKGTSAPAAPNQADLAQKQAEANRVSTFSPFGNVLFGSVGENGAFVPSDNGSQAAASIQPTGLQADTIGLQQQTENDVARQLSGRVANLPQGAIDLSGLPELNTDFSQQGQQLEQSSFDRAMGLLSPVFDQRQQQLESNLAVRGLPVGSEAANDELNLFAQQRNNAELAAAQDSVGIGRAEQSRLFGLNQAARNQGVSEQSFLRNQPFNELAAAMSGTQMSPFQGQPVNASPIDFLGPASLSLQAQNAAFGAQNQRAAGLTGGLFSLGGSAISAFGSDRRLKRDISRVGKGRFNIYRFRYKGLPGWHIGYMAQEVAKVAPKAVEAIKGVLFVNYREAATC